MSRCFDMHFTIKGLKKIDQDKAVKYAEELWDVEGEVIDNITHLWGVDNLYGGEGDEGFVDRFTKHLWGKLGYYVNIEITCTYLDDYTAEKIEDLDSETFIRGKEYYEELFPTPNSIKFIKKGKKL